jgi:uncharacterized membrane protein HdeD (DUF308 family)
LFLITGIAWTLLAMILLRFDYTSVSAISILFGCVAIAAGVIEIGVTFLVPGWWKLLNGVLAVAFLVAGIVAFIHPGNTFVALAAVFSFFLMFAGTFDIIQSIAARREISVWWLQLIGGIIEVVLGLLGSWVLRSQRHAAGRLGGGLRDHPRRQRHRARLPRPRAPARRFRLNPEGSKHRERAEPRRSRTAATHAQPTNRDPPGAINRPSNASVLSRCVQARRDRAERAPPPAPTRDAPSSTSRRRVRARRCISTTTRTSGSTSPKANSPFGSAVS